MGVMAGANTERFGWGAAAVGKYFVFGPFNYSGVGVMDTESGAIEYYPLEISGCWENHGKYFGTIFEYDWPFQEKCWNGPEGSAENGNMRECLWGSTLDSAPWGCFAGAAALGTKVYFTPHNANAVGVFDTATMSWGPLIPLNVNQWGTAALVVASARPLRGSQRSSCCARIWELSHVLWRRRNREARC